MSIRKMISLHPNVTGHLNEPLALAAKHAMYCALFCTSCADADVAEDMDMTQCIRLCLDCAEICTATAKVATRRTGENDAMVRAQLRACIEACQLCAAECEKHEHGHCKLCAEMCRECERDCGEALATLG